MNEKERNVSGIFLIHAKVLETKITHGAHANFLRTLTQSKTKLYEPTPPTPPTNPCNHTTLAKNVI